MLGAIVLGGGRSSRMGADKLALRLDGSSLLARTCAAAATLAERVVVAGPDQPGLDVVFVREDPPFGGPAAGIAAALRALEEATDVLVLAGDLADPGAAVSLLAAAELDRDGVVLADERGWPQYLAGRYRADALRRAVANAGDVHGLPVRKLLGGLALTHVPAPADATLDIDTPDQARRAGLT